MPAVGSQLTIPNAIRALRLDYGVEVNYQRLWRTLREGRVAVARSGRELLLEKNELPQLANMLTAPKRRAR